jgi:hypothetical protein
MATKSGGSSKREKNSHHQSSKSKASSSGTESSEKNKSNFTLNIPGTSECSMSISGSMDSSDDHSNGSVLTNDGTMSEGGMSECRSKVPTPALEDSSSLHQLLQHHKHNNLSTSIASSNSTLTNLLSSQSTLSSALSPFSLHSPKETEKEGLCRSPSISIPRLPLSSTAMNLGTIVGNKTTRNATSVFGEDSEFTSSNSKPSSPEETQVNSVSENSQLQDSVKDCETNDGFSEKGENEETQKVLDEQIVTCKSEDNAENKAPSASTNESSSS